MQQRDYSKLADIFKQLDDEVESSFPSDEGLLIFLQNELGCNFSTAISFVAAWVDFNTYYGQ